jgi:pimeloyl-ACP methyl ester carboxylesterase
MCDTRSAEGSARSADGVEIRFETVGSGRPAIGFVHGWCCDRSYWRGQREHFASRHQVVTVDLAGHGESGAARSGWTISAFAEDVVAVVEQLGLEEVVLVGHSMGGDVVVPAAERLAGRVVGVVWVDTYPSLGEPQDMAEHRRQIRRFRDDFVGTTSAMVRGFFLPSSDPGLADWVVADMSSAPPDIALAALVQATTFEPSLIAALPGLTAPVFAINPDYRPTDVDGLAQYGVQVRLMPGVGHFAMLEDPAGFNRILADVIGTLKAGHR